MWYIPLILMCYYDMYVYSSTIFQSKILMCSYDMYSYSTTIFQNKITKRFIFSVDISILCFSKVANTQQFDSFLVLRSINGVADRCIPVHKSGYRWSDIYSCFIHRTFCLRQFLLESWYLCLQRMKSGILQYVFYISTVREVRVYILSIYSHFWL